MEGPDLLCSNCKKAIMRRKSLSSAKTLKIKSENFMILHQYNHTCPSCRKILCDVCMRGSPVCPNCLDSLPHSSFEKIKMWKQHYLDESFFLDLMIGILPMIGILGTILIGELGTFLGVRSNSPFFFMVPLFMVIPGVMVIMIIIKLINFSGKSSQILGYLWKKVTEFAISNPERLDETISMLSDNFRDFYKKTKKLDMNQFIEAQNPIEFYIASND